MLPLRTSTGISKILSQFPVEPSTSVTSTTELAWNPALWSYSTKQIQSLRSSSIQSTSSSACCPRNRNTHLWLLLSSQGTERVCRLWGWRFSYFNPEKHKEKIRADHDLPVQSAYFYFRKVIKMISVLDEEIKPRRSDVTLSGKAQSSCKAGLAERVLSSALWSACVQDSHICVHVFPAPSATNSTTLTAASGFLRKSKAAEGAGLGFHPQLPRQCQVSPVSSLKFYLKKTNTSGCLGGIVG